MASGEERDRWPKLKQALGQAIEQLGTKETAAYWLLHRLADGIIVAIADRMTETNLLGVAPNQVPLVQVPTDVWAQYLKLSDAENSDIWSGSDLMLRSGTGNQTTKTTKYYGVRLHPDQLADELGIQRPKLVSDALKPTKGQTVIQVPEFELVAPPAAPSPERATVEKRPVSQADLDKWAKVFVGVHGKDFKGDFARRSAEAMFPDNAVGRDRLDKAISNLIGKRKRGPKKKSDQEN